VETLTGEKGFGVRGWGRVGDSSLGSSRRRDLL